MAFLIYFGISLLFAIIVRIDARIRKNKTPLTWGLIVFIFSVFGLIAYIISIKKQVKALPYGQLSAVDLIEILESNGFIIEYRKNLSVKGHVILFEGEEYEIITNKNKFFTNISLVIPTHIRLIYGLIITVSASVIISQIAEGYVVFGLLFLLLSTYIVDYFYKNNKGHITEKITENIAKVLLNL